MALSVHLAHLVQQALKVILVVPLDLQVPPVLRVILVILVVPLDLQVQQDPLDPHLHLLGLLGEQVIYRLLILKLSLDNLSHLRMLLIMYILILLIRVEYTYQVL